LRDRGTHPAGLDEVDAGDLAAASGDLQVDYLPLLGQEGYLVRGWSHIIAGYPRTGKTELVTACCRDWLAMGERVLYLSEEPRSVWEHRLCRAPEAWAGLRLVFALGVPPLDLLARAKSGKESV